MSQDPDGKYYVSVLFAYEQMTKQQKAEKIIGLYFSMKDMSKALRFGKSVHDNGCGMFVMFLQYKLIEEGKQLVKVDKWFPSSKTCSACGKKKEELALSERVYICECENIMDRD